MREIPRLQTRLPVFAPSLSRGRYGSPAAWGWMHSGRHIPMFFSTAHAVRGRGPPPPKKTRGRKHVPPRSLPLTTPVRSPLLVVRPFLPPSAPVFGARCCTDGAACGLASVRHSDRPRNTAVTPRPAAAARAARQAGVKAPGSSWTGTRTLCKLRRAATLSSSAAATSSSATRFETECNHPLRRSRLDTQYTCDIPALSTGSITRQLTPRRPSLHPLHPLHRPASLPSLPPATPRPRPCTCRSDRRGCRTEL